MKSSRSLLACSLGASMGDDFEWLLRQSVTARQHIATMNNDLNVGWSYSGTFANSTNAPNLIVIAPTMVLRPFRCVIGKCASP